METIKAVTDIAMTLSNLTKTEEVGKHIFAEEIDIAVDIVNTIGRLFECFKYLHLLCDFFIIVQYCRNSG